MSVLVVACMTSTPLFPPEIMKDIRNDTFVFKAWKDQALYPSANFVSQKVELEGRILKVIPELECLHIWKTQEAKMPDFVGQVAMGDLPRNTESSVVTTVCADHRPPGGSQDDKEQDSAAS
jgi:hypothetical protein